MSLTYENGRKTTREDSRMLAFFDALVQRDINGLSDEDSDNFPETSYTNTVYTTPETTSSENEGILQLLGLIFELLSKYKLHFSLVVFLFR